MSGQKESSKSVFPPTMKSVAAVFILFISFCSMAIAQPAIWSNPWIVNTPPTLAFVDNYFLYTSTPHGSPVAFSTSGDIVFGTPAISFRGYQFVRVSEAGALRWSVNIAAELDDYGQILSSMIAADDGSAIVGTGDGTNVIKISAQGSILWSRRVDAYQMVEFPDHSIGTAGCTALRRLDSSTGATLWQYTVPATTYSHPNGCATIRLTADDFGNTYLVVQDVKPDTSAIYSYQTIKLDPRGTVLWKTARTNSDQSASIFGVGADFIYVSTTYGVTTQHISDGSDGWSSTAVSAAGVVGDPGEPIVYSGDQLQRLNGSTGASRWSRDSNGLRMVFSSPNTAIAISAVEPYFFQRIDVSTGSALWSNSPSSGLDTFGNSLYPTAITSDAFGRLIVVSQQVYYYLFPVTPAVVVQRIDAASGADLGIVPIATVGQGLYERSALSDATHVVDAAIVRMPEGNYLRVRSVNTLTGTTEWETVDSSYSFGMPDIGNGDYYGLSIIATADLVVVGIQQNGIYTEAFSRASGVRQWQNSIWDPGQYHTHSDDLVIDSNGDIFQSFGTDNTCDGIPIGDPQSICSQQVLAKISATDGSTIWQFVNKPEISVFGDNPYPEPFAFAGNDVIVGGPFGPDHSTDTLLKLSGIDGSVVWSAQLPWVSGDAAASSVASIKTMPAGRVLVGANFIWTSVDQATGAVEWKNASADTCTYNCYGYDYLKAANGDLLFVGSMDRTSYVVFVQNAKDGLQQSWILEPSNPFVRSAAIQIKQDVEGGIWLRLNRHSLAGDIMVLGKFDLASGALTSQQIIYADYLDPAQSTLYPMMISPPENNRLLVNAWVVDPYIPTTDTNALLGIAIAANGDLGLQATLDQTNVVPGQVVGFHLTATYTGDVPLHGVHLNANSPWMSSPANTLCITHSASNCAVEGGIDRIRYTFDIEPGGSVDISGTLQVTAGSELQYFNAKVVGPISLNEPDTVNNFARASVTQSLFSSGFDPVATAVH